MLGNPGNPIFKVDDNKILRNEDDLLDHVCAGFREDIRNFNKNPNINVGLLDDIHANNGNHYNIYRICMSIDDPQPAAGSSSAAAAPTKAGKNRKSISLQQLDRTIKGILYGRDYSFMYDAVNFSIDAMYQETLNQTDQSGQGTSVEIPFIQTREGKLDPALKPNPFLKVRFGQFGDVDVKAVLESSDSIPVTYTPFQVGRDPLSLFYSKFNISITPPIYTNSPDEPSVTAIFRDGNSVVYETNDLNVEAPKVASIIKDNLSNTLKTSAISKSKMMGDQCQALSTFQLADRALRYVIEQPNGRRSMPQSKLTDFELDKIKNISCIVILLTLDRPLVALLLTLGSIFGY
ncbi:MAG: hypothetical protein EB127_31565, partial [Alphaproteobacteria bacterium]|nr:hypothetical protein [Alphaproteobacteria bacterium]